MRFLAKKVWGESEVHMKKKNNGVVVAVLVLTAVLVFALVYAGISLVGSLSSGGTMDTDKAQKRLNRLVSSIEVTELEPQKASVQIGTTSLADELPEIDKYPLTVEGYGTLDVEIFTSPEKGGTGTDSWLVEVAEDFNREGYTIDGQTVSVSVRTLASGLAADYIVSGKYRPDAFTPSNELWISMLQANGVEAACVEERLVGNVAGIVVSRQTYNLIEETYGEVSVATMTKATAENKIAMGYTNPYSSSTGMNFLISALYEFDHDDILSNAAMKGFEDFQKNVPFVAYTTMQMRDAVKSGSFDGLILEYQTFQNTSELASYQFIPFGARHDNPLYSIGRVDADTEAALELFAEYCLNDESQKQAEECGFNGYDDYVSQVPEYDGKTLLAAQSFWKENKDSGRPIAAIFVADISGSMSGEPITELKNSLVNSAQYINSSNSIGLVSYSDEVYINLPIGEFDINQWSYFTGAVNGLSATGGTATYDGICVGIQMLLEELEVNPDCRPMLFVLSDGYSNTGCNLSDVKPILEAYNIPVYSICYNDGDFDSLQELSDINEAVCINADSEDVVYQLKCLFNSQM